LAGAKFGHPGAMFFLGVALAAVSLGAALFKPGDPFRATLVEFCLRLDKIEGVGEQFGWLAEGSAVELLLDPLFDGGIEGDGHGMSIRLERGGGKRFLRLF
jgi:hypothetical protein